MSTSPVVRSSSDGTKWFVAASFLLVALLVIAASLMSYGEPAQFGAVLIGA
jgi:hypothetical protein